MLYILHFDQPISPDSTTQHYMGYAQDVNSRLSDRKAGKGARLTQVANERGIGYNVVWTAEGDRKAERAMKNRKKNFGRWCPVCKGEH